MNPHDADTYADNAKNLRDTERANHADAWDENWVRVGGRDYMRDELPDADELAGL